MSIFSVSIGKEQLCFTAAHFIAFKGFREPLHGHTYQAEVKVSGPVGPDGYVVDFLVLKKNRRRRMPATAFYHPATRTQRLPAYYRGH